MTAFNASMPNNHPENLYYYFNSINLLVGLSVLLKCPILTGGGNPNRHIIITEHIVKLTKQRGILILIELLSKLV